MSEHSGHDEGNMRTETIPYDTVRAILSRLQDNFEELENLECLSHAFHHRLYGPESGAETARFRRVEKKLHERIECLVEYLQIGDTKKPPYEDLGLSCYNLYSADEIESLPDKQRLAVEAIHQSERKVESRIRFAENPGEKSDKVTWGYLIETEDLCSQVEHMIRLVKEFFIQRVSGLELNFDIGFRYSGVDRFAGVHDFAMAATNLAQSYSSSVHLGEAHVFFSSGDYQVSPFTAIYVIPMAHLGRPDLWCHLAHEACQMALHTDDNKVVMDSWLRSIADYIRLPTQWTDVSLDFRNWLEEMVSDALALRIAGPAYLYTLESRFRAPLYRRPVGEKSWPPGRLFEHDMTSTHPPMYFRARLLADMSLSDDCRGFFGFDALKDKELGGRIDAVKKSLDDMARVEMMSVMTDLEKQRDHWRRTRELSEIVAFILEDPQTLIDEVTSPDLGISWDQVKEAYQGEGVDLSQALTVDTLLDYHKKDVDIICRKFNESLKAKDDEDDDIECGVKFDLLWDGKRELLETLDEIREKGSFADLIFKDKMRAHSWLLVRWAQMKLLYLACQVAVKMFVLRKCSLSPPADPGFDSFEGQVWVPAEREVMRLIDSFDPYEYSTIRIDETKSRLITYDRIEDRDPRDIVNALWWFDTKKVADDSQLVQTVIESLRDNENDEKADQMN